VPGEYTVRECPSCGLWVTSPQPIPEDLHAIYPDDYPPYSTPSRTGHDLPEPARGTLLDVGCASGKYLSQQRALGWDGRGIEFSESAALIARSRGFEVTVGDAVTVPYPDERFDRVRCNHVLEHVSDPLALLGRLRDAVKDEGTVEVVVPNRGGILNALFGRYWHGLDLPRHLVHFRLRDLRRLAGMAGLRIVDVHHVSSPSQLLGSIDRLIARRRGAPPSPPLRTRQGLRRLAFPLTWLFARLRTSGVVEIRLERA
jgi:SAM-dependent methyltransferase